jgi:nucleoid-associated protein YgaU
MRSRKSLIKFLIPVISFVFILSCEFDVPVKEIITAKSAIEEAKKFDAEKYAPEEMKKAETLLLQSHDLITDNKADDAKKAANDAYAAAMDAEKKCLPQYAAEQIKKSDEAYTEADLAYAEKFSPEKFAEAGALNAEAKSLYEKNDYKKSAVSSMKAYDLSVAAKNESLQNSSVIEKEVTSAENKLTELKSDKFSSAAEGNLSSAGTSIDKAKKGMESRDYKTSLQEIELARKELESAAELIKKQKIYASIQSLRAEMNEMQGKSDSADVKQDLDSAMLELNGAESSLEQNNITDAEVKVEQAEKLISGTNVKMKKKNALAAIEKAEKLLVQARGKDSDSKYKENLDKAETVIGQGRSSNEAGKYNEGLASAEEAETIISAVLNSMEAAAADMAVKSEKDEHAEDGAVKDETKTVETKTEETKTGEKAITEPEKPSRTYTVQWRKKNTDCLWRIAEKVYKDASYWPAIYLANKDQIKDPDLIFPGQKFIIPPKPQKKPSYKKIKEQIKEKTK